jgi:hypothetical protein
MDHAIVAHLAPLAAADGCVYLVDAERRPWLFPAYFVTIGRRT